MTHNLNDLGTNIQEHNGSLKLQENTLNSCNAYLESKSITANSDKLVREARLDSEAGDMEYPQELFGKNNISLEENEKKNNKDYFLEADKYLEIYFGNKKPVEPERFPRYGISEKSTQTYVTMQEMDDYEAKKLIPQKESFINLLQNYPDLFPKIFAKFCYENIFFEGRQNPQKMELEENVHSASSENFGVNKSKMVQKIESSGEKAEKNDLFLNLAKNQSKSSKSLLQEKLTSRKRKIPLNYYDFNKNGLMEKNAFNETAKIKQFPSSNIQIFNSKVTQESNNFSFKVHSEVMTKSENKILIKRKFDNRKKNKFKNSKTPYLHVSKSNELKIKTSISKMKKNEMNSYVNSIVYPEGENSNFPENEMKNLIENFQSTNYEKNKLKEKKLHSNSFINVKHVSNFTNNLSEKNKYIMSQENFPISSNEDFTKSSLDFSILKNSLNDQLNEIRQAGPNFLTSSDVNHQDKALEGMRDKVRFGLNTPGKNKTENHQKISIYDTNMKLSDDSLLLNGEAKQEEKINNKEDANKPRNKIEQKKVGKKFDPISYFRKEYYQSHKDRSNKTQQELDKDCEKAWKELDKDLKSVYIRMADDEKKNFKKLKKLNALNMKE